MRITTITTRYDRAEDRILLSVADAERATRKLWLTRRLTRRLIPALIDGLDAQIRAPEHAPRQAIEVAHIYAQLQARVTRKPAQPVKPAERTPAHLIDEIGIRRGKDAARTVRFSSPDLPEPAELALSANELRQWLESLKRAVEAGDWGLDVFPAWLQPRAG